MTNQGKARWLVIDEAFDAEKRIEFLHSLIKDAGKKTFLILDQSAGASQQTGEGLGS